MWGVFVILPKELRVEIEVLLNSLSNFLFMSFFLAS